VLWQLCPVREERLNDRRASLGGFRDVSLWGKGEGYGGGEWGRGPFRTSSPTFGKVDEFPEDGG
jgi:hypothetical protein